MKHLFALCALLALGVTAGCADDARVVPAPTDGVSTAVRGRIQTSQAPADRVAIGAALQHAHPILNGTDWRAAVAEVDRVRAAHAGAAWLPEFEMAMGNLLLARHFADRETLTPEQAEVAGRYADVLLALDGVGSDALNRTLIALRPHWGEARFATAANTAITRASDARCPECGTMPDAVAAQLEAGALAARASADDVRAALR